MEADHALTAALLASGRAAVESSQKLLAKPWLATDFWVSRSQSQSNTQARLIPR
jgi:hypothetical protein